MPNGAILIEKKPTKGPRKERSRSLTEIFGNEHPNIIMLGGQEVWAPSQTIAKIKQKHRIFDLPQSLSRAIRRLPKKYNSMNIVSTVVFGVTQTIKKYSQKPYQNVIETDFDAYEKLTNLIDHSTNTKLVKYVRDATITIAHQLRKPIY